MRFGRRESAVGMIGSVRIARLAEKLRATEVSSKRPPFIEEGDRKRKGWLVEATARNETTTPSNPDHPCLDELDRFCRKTFLTQIVVKEKRCQSLPAG